MSQVGECMFIIGLRKYLFKGMINLKRGLSRALKLDIYSFTKPSRKALSFSYGDIRHSQKI